MLKKNNQLGYILQKMVALQPPVSENDEGGLEWNYISNLSVGHLMQTLDLRTKIWHTTTVVEILEAVLSYFFPFF